MSNHARGNNTALRRRDNSVDITKNTSEVLRLLALLKKRKAQREKKAWIPAGLNRIEAQRATPKQYY